MLTGIKFSAPSSGKEKVREQKNVGRRGVYSF